VGNLILRAWTEHQRRACPGRGFWARIQAVLAKSTSIGCNRFDDHRRLAHRQSFELALIIGHKVIAMLLVHCEPTRALLRLSHSYLTGLLSVCPFLLTIRSGAIDCSDYAVYEIAKFVETGDHRRRKPNAGKAHFMTVTFGIFDLANDCCAVYVYGA
jgi:hypothetical protein